MKRKLRLKILGALLFIGTGLYIYKNWETYNNKTEIELDDITYSQAKLNVESIKTEFKNPIWLVKTETPVISFRMTFRNEGNRAFKNQMKILAIVCNGLMQGAGNRDSSEFKKVLNDHSMSMSFTNDEDSIVIDITCLRRHFELAIDLLCDVLSKAHMKKEKIEIAKQEYITYLSQMKFSPQFIANEKLENILYKKGHPYYFSSDECSKAVSSYTKDDIDKVYSIIFNPNDAEITIAGNIDNNTLTNSFNKIFKVISQKNHKFENVLQKAALYDRKKHEHAELDNAQSAIVFALPGIINASPERFPLRFAVMVFGYGFNSRLFNSVRNNGLAYFIYTKTDNLDLQNTVFGAVDTRPENVKKVIEIIKEECKKFYEKGITKEELKLFKSCIFAHNVLDTTKEVLNFVDNRRSDSIKIENINNYLYNFYDLTIEEVNAAIRKVFNPDNLVIVDCGKSVKDTENIKKEEEKCKK
ncbi:MAG: insulinase family protein [Holosporales bacterium]|jgi:zinc protease|nr:insulinase family protein [Holosporales bacterium]